MHLLMKVLSFAMTIALTRHQKASMRGLSFAADLYVNSALFIAKEAIRACNARRGARSAKDASTTFAFAFMSSVVFVVVALPIVSAHIYLTQPTEFRQAFSAAMIAAALFGMVLDLLAEPAVTVCVAAGNYNVKVVTEGLAIMVRLATVSGCIVLRETLMPAADDLVVAAFAYSCGLMTSGLFSIAFAANALANMVRTDEALRTAAASKQLQLFDGSRIAHRMWKATVGDIVLYRELFSESILRLILTEGEKAVLAAKGNLAAQGIYDVVSSLAALIVRLLFRVWEDFAFSVWSAPDKTNSGTLVRVSPEKWTLLHVMMRAASYLGAAATIFGPPLAPRFLGVLYGSSWATDAAVAVFQAFMLYLPLLAANGLLEAFVRATATPATLRNVKVFMSFGSCAYIAACYVVLFVLDLDVVALVYVNSANLSARIIFSLAAIMRDKSKQEPSLRKCLPSFAAASFVACSIVGRILVDAYASAGALRDAMCVIGAVTSIVACVVVDDDAKAFYSKARRR